MVKTIPKTHYDIESISLQDIFFKFLFRLWLKSLVHYTTVMIRTTSVPSVAWLLIPVYL